MSTTNCYSSTFDKTKESSIKNNLKNNGFELKAVNYAFWSAKNKEVTITFYKSGKILVQGKNVEAYLKEYFDIGSLLPQPKDHPVSKPTNQKNHDCWIGTDESGKGDYFGPLVIASVLVDKSNIQLFQELGIKDSKKINDETISKLAIKIKANSVFSVVTINPSKYNQLYEKFKNLNTLLAWGHARAIENILEKKECGYAISDKFGNESLIINALLTHGKKIELEQRTKAEDDIAVAAASIIARNEFVQRIKKLSEEYGIDLPKGASQLVKERARAFIAKQGKTSLGNVAKLHFKTTLELV